MEKVIKRFSMLVLLAFLIGVFLNGTEYYFNKKEIKLLTSGCYEAGGTPMLETSFLLQGYSFWCDVEN
ncbi:hypothetical protein [Pontibacillus marinus]|uniref:Uncharacterized protein n=1 Tax=Pontibacillus marinus BH030004 = DSM 16465 TaxID=1385511 RepID=A0A0A5HKI3_9BACI|nr:hypothetical protein [Pontibacillus marinus]KGX84147.1 hypothetical protein N783_18930 [Pontibacillus marinus BH030004 = DSM 16465]